MDEGDYIVEMGGRGGWVLEAFWWKTKNGKEAIFGNATGGYDWPLDTSEATNPMIIGVGMADHIDT